MTFIGKIKGNMYIYLMNEWIQTITNLFLRLVAWITSCVPRIVHYNYANMMSMDGHWYHNYLTISTIFTINIYRDLSSPTINGHWWHEILRMYVYNISSTLYGWQEGTECHMSADTYYHWEMDLCKSMVGHIRHNVSICHGSHTWLEVWKSPWIVSKTFNNKT